VPDEQVASEPAAEREPSLGDRAVFGVYRAGAAVARRLPGSAVDGASRLAGRLMATAAPGRRRMVARHLQRIHGNALSPDAVRREVRRAFASYGRYWIDSFRVVDLDPAEITAGMTSQGLEYVDEAIAAGNGAILALPHLGAWDFGGAWLALNGYPLTVVVEPVEPPELFEWFAEYRRGLGMEVVPLSPTAGATLSRVLRSNGRIALLSDRDIGGTGVEVEFFGERTTLPGGPATLALRTCAALLPTTVYYNDDGTRRGIVRPPLDTTRQGTLREDVARITQALADQLAEMISEAPEQWHVFQPNWPSDRENTA
jgi:phosphatidylinositol dimannoside acyltransferase